VSLIASSRSPAFSPAYVRMSARHGRRWSHPFVLCPTRFVDKTLTRR